MSRPKISVDLEELRTAVEHVVNITDGYTRAEVDAKVKIAIDQIQALISAAPDLLNTFKEISAALNNDPNFATTIATQMANKVDKVTGKQLSTNDYTTAEKTKLAGIATGATNYLHPATHPASMVIFSDNLTFQQKLDNGTLRGPAGPAGPTGPAGVAGAAGPAGATGATGPAGTMAYTYAVFS